MQLTCSEVDLREGVLGGMCVCDTEGSHLRHAYVTLRKKMMSGGSDMTLYIALDHTVGIGYYIY